LKFKLDENLSPALAGAFAVAGHEAHSILEQSLGGKSDAAAIESVHAKAAGWSHSISTSATFSSIRRPNTLESSCYA
jgi:hypothetical protein